jgi:hypothetical protein
VFTGKKKPAVVKTAAVLAAAAKPQGASIPAPPVARADSGRPAPASAVPASAGQGDVAKLSAVISAQVAECDAVSAQFAHVPTLREAIQQRDQLHNEFAALNAAKTNFLEIARVGTAHKAAIAAVLQLPLSEEDYLTLAGRYEALVQKVTATCAELADAGEFDALVVLAAKLEELKALDVSILAHTGDNDPVQPPATTAANSIAACEVDDGIHDPGYVPPDTDKTTPLEHTLE